MPEGCEGVAPCELPPAGCWLLLFTPARPPPGLGMSGLQLGAHPGGGCHSPGSLQVLTLDLTHVLPSDRSPDLGVGFGGLLSPL